MDKRYFVVAGACLTQFTIIGLLFSYGLFFKVFEEEFGWSRTLLSGAMSLAFLMMGVLAIFGGRLNDRYGPRIVLSITGLFYGAGFALISQVSQPWQLFAIFGLFIGLGMSTHDVVTLSTVARWFEKRRGIMTAVVKIGTAAGQATLPLLAAFLIAWIGWRDALIVLGVLASGVLLRRTVLMLKVYFIALPANLRSGMVGLASYYRVLTQICPRRLRAIIFIFMVIHPTSFFQGC